MKDKATGIHEPSIVLPIGKDYRDPWQANYYVMQLAIARLNLKAHKGSK